MTDSTGVERPCSGCGEPLRSPCGVLAYIVVDGKSYHHQCDPRPSETPTALICGTCAGPVGADGVSCTNVLCGVVRKQQADIERLFAAVRAPRASEVLSK
jgi:hypothetical protein